eukprot:6477339-Pyramimonas_sp.AAC.1
MRLSWTTAPTSSAHTPKARSSEIPTMSSRWTTNGFMPMAHSDPERGQPWAMPEAATRKNCRMPASRRHAVGKKWKPSTKSSSAPSTPARRSVSSSQSWASDGNASPKPNIAK